MQNLPTDTVAATAKWGAIEDWDVSGVTDFSWAFTKHRTEAGGVQSFNSNSKVVSFNSDLGKWNTAKVVDLTSMFSSATTFTGIGLSKWITTSFATLDRTFSSTAINADFGKWDTAEVTSLKYTFASCPQLVGVGLSKWNVAKIANFANSYVYMRSLC